MLTINLYLIKLVLMTFFPHSKGNMTACVGSFLKNIFFCFYLYLIFLKNLNYILITGDADDAIIFGESQ